MDLDNIELMEQDESDDEEQAPKVSTYQKFNFLKFTSVLFYLATLCLYVAYYETSNFSNIYLKQLFWLFLVVRPVLVVIYSWFTAAFNLHQAIYTKTKIFREKEEERKLGIQSKQKDSDSQSENSFNDSVAFASPKKKKGNVNDIMVEIDYEHPEIPQLDELIWNFVLMPIIIYGGFGRMIIVSERKKTF
jgi:hypothetical protein